MAVTYSTTAINARLNGVVTAIGANGLLVLRQGSTTISSIVLGNPCGTVSDGILTFVVGVDVGAAATGSINNAIVTNSGGNTLISDLSVGIPLSTSNVIISNGLNSTLISSGQTVALYSAQITGT